LCRGSNDCSVEVPVEQRGFGLNERPKVVEEMTRHAVDRQSPKHDACVEFGEKSIFQRVGVRVGRNYFAEKIL
jgi:hypothetical protein